jgi:hypothetical protein
VCVTRRWQQQTPTRSRATLRPTHARVHPLSRGVRTLAAMYQPVVSRHSSLQKHPTPFFPHPPVAATSARVFKAPKRGIHGAEVALVLGATCLGATGGTRPVLAGLSEAGARRLGGDVPRPMLAGLGGDVPPHHQAAHWRSVRTHLRQRRRKLMCLMVLLRAGVRGAMRGASGSSSFSACLPR